MVPAAITDKVVDELAAHLQPDDTIIDGGNSYFQDDRRRSAHLKKSGIHYLDVGTSGGVWGLERGYCMMIGGDKEAVDRMDPIFGTPSPQDVATWIERPDAINSAAPPKMAICIVGLPGPVTSSRWSTTESNMV